MLKRFEKTRSWENWISAHWVLDTSFGMPSLPNKHSCWKVKAIGFLAHDGLESTGGMFWGQTNGCCIAGQITKVPMFPSSCDAKPQQCLQFRDVTPRIQQFGENDGWILSLFFGSDNHRSATNGRMLASNNSWFLHVCSCQCFELYFRFLQSRSIDQCEFFDLQGKDHANADPLIWESKLNLAVNKNRGFQLKKYQVKSWSIFTLGTPGNYGCVCNRVKGPPWQCITFLWAPARITSQQQILLSTRSQPLLHMCSKIGKPPSSWRQPDHACTNGFWAGCMHACMHAWIHDII